jgi:hypothetical protein
MTRTAERGKRLGVTGTAAGIATNREIQTGTVFKSNAFLPFLNAQLRKTGLVFLPSQSTSHPHSAQIIMAATSSEVGPPEDSLKFKTKSCTSRFVLACAILKKGPVSGPQSSLTLL